MPLTLNGNGTEAGAIFNRPAFLVSRNLSQQVLSEATNTIIQFDTETIDTDNCYDLTTHKFTPTTAGTYFISANATLSTTSTPKLENAKTFIYKNTSVIAQAEVNPSNSLDMAAASNFVSTIVEMNGTTDFLQAYAYIEAHNGTRIVKYTNGLTYFCGYKLLF